MPIDAFFDIGIFDDSLFDNTTPSPSLLYPPDNIDISLTKNTSNVVQSTYFKTILNER
jgi:hypothetical protein